MPFDYTSGNPDNLVGGGPARMQDIQGPFYDIRAWLNSAAGSAGGSASVLAAVPVLDVGMAGQRRAGRQLANADFTSLGLSVPLALWNLNDLTDASGNGRVLTNKNGVGFGNGINGIAASAAAFNGPAASALYIADTGAADSFRIKTGSWGCWFKTAKRGLYQQLLAKSTAVAGGYGYSLLIQTSNVLQGWVSVDGSSVGGALTVSDICDDRWHFAVCTFDGTLVRTYIDAVLEAAAPLLGAIFASAGPLNIGGFGGDGATNPSNPHYGRVDEAFVTADVLTEDQVRCLYASKVTHTLTTTPSAVTLNVHRRRKGADLAVTDFTTQPLRLYNLIGGATSPDLGSNGIALTNGAAAIVAGPDGTGSAHSFNGAGSDSATDAGLPSLLTTRTYGCWLKTTVSGTTMVALSWGTNGGNHANIYVASGQIASGNGADSMNGPWVADGAWHHVVAVEDNAAADGVKRKLYVDGRLVANSTTLVSITLAGVNRFRIGANPDGATFFTGQIDGAFVCGYALTQEDVAKLYLKSSQDLGASPKAAGDHIERTDTASLLLIADSLDGQNTIDLGVVA